MKCPRCKSSITESFGPDTIVTCPGCGSRLMTRAAALRSQGGKSNPPKPPLDLDLTPPVINPPQPPAPPDSEAGGGPPTGGEAVPKSEAAPGTEADPAPAAASAAATLDAVLIELQMLRATQMQILELLKRGPAAGPREGAPDETQVLRPVRSRRRKTVLLVDDDAETQKAAVEELQRADVPVRAVHEGNAALAAIAEEKPDVIALELGLGGDMGGKDVINMIKATMEWVDIPIILWTREAVTTQKEARQDHGADEVVTKSSGPAALVTRVITVFRSG
jgi:CheY-like chemotaxis protein